jgi:hypothetical protein
MSLFLGSVTSQVHILSFKAQALQPSLLLRFLSRQFALPSLNTVSFVLQIPPGEPAGWVPPTGLGLNCPTLTPRDITPYIKLLPRQSNHLMSSPQLLKSKNKRTNSRRPPISDNLPPAHGVKQDPATIPNLRQYLTPRLHSTKNTMATGPRACQPDTAASPNRT